MSVKDQIIAAIQRLPSDITYRDIAEEVAFLAAIAEAEEDIEKGALVSNEEIARRVKRWTTS